MRQFKWGGFEIDVLREPLTSDWWEWITNVSLSVFAHKQAQFVQPFLSVGYQTIVEGCSIEHPRSLGDGLFLACVPQNLAQCLTLVYGADKLDRSKLNKVCACQACSGLSDDASDCRFVSAEVSIGTRLIANQEPDLIASMWGLPYSLYALACEQRRATREGALASQFPTESERKKHTHDAAFERLRKHHGHA